MPINSVPVVTVSQVNNVISSLLSNDARLSRVAIKGELSSFTRHYQSGHLYFALKDAKTMINGVMFADSAAQLNFEPAVGMTVICYGSIVIHAASGKYQIKCFSMRQEGEGEQAAALEELKRRLAAEGLFEQHRPIPAKPKKIAVVTSAGGAALQDIITTIDRRYPLVKLIVIPAQVQGAAAPQSIAAGIRKAAQTDADTIILGRGGGASDDLSAFNAEIVARAIYESPIPTISAVGHEINFTVADLTADMRAATPTAAAELAVPDIAVIYSSINESHRRLQQSMARKLDACDRALEAKSELIRALSPQARLSAFEQRVDSLSNSISRSIHNRLDSAERSVLSNADMISALNPMSVLARGYSVTESNGRILSTIDGIENGDKLDIRLADGTITASVLAVERNNNTDGI